MTPPRKKRKTRIGSKTLLLLAALTGVSAGACRAQGAPRAEQARDNFTVIFGTVFRDSGFALGGAEVTLTPLGKGRKQQAVSDARGEFAFRVPRGAAKYAVHVKMKGFSAESKEVALSGEDRIDVTFSLRGESK